MNVYRHAFMTRCPANGIWVRYRLTVRSEEMIRVEDIVAACAKHEEGFHENIADALLIALGGRQVLRAHHHGVDIKTRRG